MKTRGSPLAAATFASLSAGPLFVMIVIVSGYVTSVPAAVPIPLEFVPTVTLILFLSFFIGAILAFIPILIGCSLMSVAGELSETAQDPLAWVAAGALSGAGIAALTAGFDDGAPLAAALILTAAICALICRSQFGWYDQG